MLLGAVKGTSLGVGIRSASVGVVKVDGTTINFLTLHGLVGLGSLITSGEVNVAETLAATGAFVIDNAGTDEAFEALESLVQAVIVNTPA